MRRSESWSLIQNAVNRIDSNVNQVNKASLVMKPNFNLSPMRQIQPLVLQQKRDET